MSYSKGFVQFSILMIIVGFLVAKIYIIPNSGIPKPVDEIKRISSFNVHKIASKNHSSLPYRNLWKALEHIDGEGNFVRLIYSRELRLKTRNGGNIGDWNREHIFPRSYGIGSSGADFTDLHAIFPCDAQNNSRRGNKLLGELTNKHTWAVPEEIRGDLARAVFYMVVRYDGEEPETEDLKIEELADSSNHTFGNLSMLLKWHLNDPVDDRERLRNARIKEIQGNDNPFIIDESLVQKYFSKALN